MSPRTTHKVSPPDPAQAGNIVQLLSALEYGTKKEEKDLIAKAFGDFGIERRANTAEVAQAIATSPGFEPFFLALVAEVKPFAQMLSEIYAFLGRHATVGRRASAFLVTTQGAETAFDFSLAAFPKYLLPLMMNGRVEQAAMVLASPRAGAPDADPLVARWEALSGVWDNDFYDRSERYTRFSHSPRTHR